MNILRKVTGLDWDHWMFVNFGNSAAYNEIGDEGVERLCWKYFPLLEIIVLGSYDLKIQSNAN